MNYLPAKIYIGGSFDPVHIAHTAMAERIQAQLNALNTPHEIYFLPTAGSPLKNTKTTTNDRLQMLSLATEATSFFVDVREANQKPPVFTIETLTQLRKELGSQTPIIFVLGLDSLVDLPKWKQGGELLNFCHFWLFDRQKCDPLQNNIQKNMTKYLKNSPFELNKKVTDHIKSLLTHSNGYIFLDSMVPPAVSSTQIRCHINNAKDLLNSKVWEYIKRNHLYQNGE